MPQVDAPMLIVGPGSFAMAAAVARGCDKPTWSPNYRLLPEGYVEIGEDWSGLYPCVWHQSPTSNSTPQSAESVVTGRGCKWVQYEYDCVDYLNVTDVL